MPTSDPARQAADLPRDQRILTKARSKIAGLLISRRLTYKAAAAEIVAWQNRVDPAHPISLGAAYLSEISRGNLEPTLRVAKAIVGWSDGALVLADVLDLEIATPPRGR